MFSKIPPPNFLGTNSSPNFVERPIPYCLDLDIYCLSNLWDPSRVVRIDLLCRHFTLVFVKRINESRVIAFSVGKPNQKPHFRVGSFSNILLK